MGIGPRFALCLSESCVLLKPCKVRKELSDERVAQEKSHKVRNHNACVESVEKVLSMPNFSAFRVEVGRSYRL